MLEMWKGNLVLLVCTGVDVWCLVDNGDKDDLPDCGPHVAGQGADSGPLGYPFSLVQTTRGLNTLGAWSCQRV